jgi:signal transduction histidine kinase
MRESIASEASIGRDGYESPPLEIELVRKDGSKIWAEMTRAFLRNEEDTPIGVVGVLRDISDRKLAERNLEKAVARAEFYTDLMAHDLSNMHQAIMASLELIRESGELPPYVAGMVDSALNQTEQCALLVSKVRMHSRIIRDKKPLVKTDPFPPLRAAIELVKNSFPDREVVFNVSFKEGEHFVLADDFLIDLYYNLFHNSVKADKNSVARIDVLAERKKERRLELRIIDRGSGIDEGTKMWITSNIDQLEYRGRGLGLTLVRQIVERYSGGISVRDRTEGMPADGSVIAITLALF